MAQFPQVGVEAVVQNVNGFLRDMGKMDSALGATADKADRSGGVIGRMGSKIAGVGKAAATAAVAGVVALGAAVVGVGLASLKTAIDFESAWAGVVKTTDGLVDEFGNLTEAGQEMQTGFRDLAKEVPVAVEELLEIGELGGQLGVAGDDLLEFTEVIAAMGVSTNLTTDAAATGFAQLANVMGTTEKFGSSAFSRLGSSIVALGNSSATTESDILSFAQRVAGASAVAGVTEADMLGISAAFTSVGIQAQAGGTAVSKTFLEMNKAALEGGEKMEIFAAVAGIGAEEFGAAWEQDAGAVFGEFVTGLGMAGDDAITILDALEIKDSQAVRAFLSLAGAGDLVTESMATANKGWEENTALATEAETRYKTTESQMILLKNTLKDVGITIGSVLLPFFNKLLQAATPLINELGKALPDLLNNTLIPAIERAANVVRLLAKAFEFALKGDIAGVIEAVWFAMFEGVGVSEKVANAVADMAGEIVTQLGKAVKGASRFITGSLLPAFQQFGQFVLNQVVPAIISFVQAVISFVQQHGPAIRNIIIAIGAAFAAAQIIATIAGIVAAIVALFNPITLLIGVIALLVAAWTENWFGIRDIIMTIINEVLIPAFTALADFVMNTLVPAFIAFGEFLISVLTPIVQAFVDFIIAAFTAVQEWVVANWPTIQETINTVLTAIQSIVTAALTAIRSFWEQNGAAIMATVSQAWEAIKGFIEAAITVIAGVIQAVMQAINGDWEAAWATLQATGENAMTILQSAIEIAMGVIETIIDAALNIIKALFAAAWEGIQMAVEMAITGLKLAINTGLKAARDIVEFILTSIKDKVTEIWDSIPEIFAAGIEAAKNALTAVVGAFRAAGEAVVQAIADGIDAAWDSLISGLRGKLDDIADMLPFSEPKDPRSPLRGLGKAGAAIADNIAAGLAGAMPVIQAQLQAAINPTEGPGPVSSISNVSNIGGDTFNIDIVSNPASQPTDQAIMFDLAAGLAAARSG